MIILILLIIVFVIAGFLLYRNNKTQTSSNQKFFLAGKIPQPRPDGFYRGQVTGYHGSWQGKTFDAKAQTGVNLLKDNGKEVKKYPFKTYVAKGIIDDRDVLKIDYDIAENPFWLRHILDEVVEVAPHSYLGKLTIKVFPGVSFALGFFKLNK